MHFTRLISINCETLAHAQTKETPKKVEFLDATDRNKGGTILGPLSKGGDFGRDIASDVDHTYVTSILLQ